MGNILGSIFVELRANTAAFVDGMSKASYTAKQAGRDIERSFSNLGSIAETALAPFGLVGGEIGQVLSQVGNWAGSASQSLAKMGGAMSVVGAGAGAAAGAIAAISAGSIAMVAHTAEAAGKLDQLSQATGVSTEALSALGFVAKQTGVESEIMVRALERMDKSADAAAVAPAGAANAYTRLGVAVRDAAGNVRPTEALFLDIAEKFANMPDGVTKTARAMEIFGRGGAALIPTLNEGKNGIQGFIDTAIALGVVLDGQTAEAAEHFHQDLNVLSAGITGMQIALMKDLLPALDSVAKAMADGFKDSSSGLNDFISGIATLTKYFLSFGGIVVATFSQLGKLYGDEVAELLLFAETTAEVQDRLLHFDVSGAKAAAKDGFAGMKAILNQFISESENTWTGYAKFSTGLFAPLQTGPLPTRKGGGGDQESTKGTAVADEKDTVADLITKLTAEAQPQNALASATDRTTAAITLQKAAGEAATKIDETRTGLLDEQKRLTAELKNAKAEGKAPEASKLELQLAGVTGLLTELEKDTPRINALYAQIGAGKFAESADDEVQKLIEKTREETAAAIAMAAALSQGPAAVGRTEEAQKIAPFEHQLEVLDQLRQKGAITAGEYEVLAAQVSKAATAIQALSLAEVGEAVAKQAQATDQQVASLNRLTAAAFASAAALRGAQVENKVQEFRVANPQASDADLARVRAQYDELDRAQHASELGTTTAQLDVSVGYQREMEELHQISEIYGSNKDIALAVAAAEVDAGRKAEQEWDRQAEAAGTFGQRMQALLNEVQLQGDQFAQHVFDAFSKSIDDISGQLAKFVVTGKSNFKQLFEGLGEQLLKAQFQNSFATLAKAISGGATPGSPSGSSVWSEAVPGAQNPKGGILGTLGGLFGLKSGAKG